MKVKNQEELSTVIYNTESGYDPIEEDQGNVDDWKKMLDKDKGLRFHYTPSGCFLIDYTNKRLILRALYRDLDEISSDTRIDNVNVAVFLSRIALIIIHLGWRFEVSVDGFYFRDDKTNREKVIHSCKTNLVWTDMINNKKYKKKNTEKLFKSLINSRKIIKETKKLVKMVFESFNSDEYYEFNSEKGIKQKVRV